MRPTPMKKLSYNISPSKSPNKLKGSSPAKPSNYARLKSPDPEVGTGKKRHSVNIDPSTLTSLMAKKKPYLSLQTFNKEYPNYPECLSSKKPYNLVKAYSMNSYRGIDRNYNEDRIVAVHNVPRPPELKDKLWPKVSYFAIFDGHAGEECANFLQKNLLNYIINHKSFLINPKEALKGAFERAEAEFKHIAIEKTGDNLKILDDSGSCAVVALFVESQCYVANVGDSRALMSYDEGKRAKQITIDHKPNAPEERKRIIAAGGKVVKDELPKEEVKSEFTNVAIEEASSSSGEDLPEIYRVEPGKLAVSRSIGDLCCKNKELGGLPGVIIPTPDIFQVDLLSNADFLLLGCDGIFDVLSNEDVVEAAWYTERICKGIHADLNLKCSVFVNNILKCAMEEESTDNLSCIIIALSNFEKETKTKFLREKVQSKIKAGEAKK